MRLQFPQVLLGILTLAVVGLVVSRFWPEAEPSVDDLQQTALHGETLDARTAAAVKLAGLGPEALDALRKIVIESVDSDVQAVGVNGLARQWDYESMDLLFEMLDAESVKVRGRAAQAIMRMTGRARPYSAQATGSQRRILAEHMRADWDEIAAASPENREELFRRLRESHNESEN